MPLLENLFFLFAGLTGVAVAIVFLLFTLLIICSMIGSWLDKSLESKDRIWFNLAAGIVVAWGGSLTYTALYAGISYLQKLI